MKALIFESVVIDVQAQTFETVPQMIWIDAPNDVEIGWIYNGRTVSAPPVVPITAEDQREEARRVKGWVNDRALIEDILDRGDAAVKIDYDQINTDNPI